MHLAVDITGLAYKYRTGIARLLEELIDRWAARIQTGAPPVRRMTLLSAFPPGTEFLEKVRNWRNVSVVASNVPSHYVWRQVGLGRMAWKCGADLLYIHEPVAPVICSVPHRTDGERFLLSRYPPKRAASYSLDLPADHTSLDPPRGGSGLHLATYAQPSHSLFSPKRKSARD